MGGHLVINLGCAPLCKRPGPGTHDGRSSAQAGHDAAKRCTFQTSSQQAMINSRPSYANQTARGVRDAPQSDKRVATRAYAENRPFLDEGKSQKSLNRQNAPLTIEQVRELLNKNK